MVSDQCKRPLKFENILIKFFGFDTYYLHKYVYITNYLEIVLHFKNKIKSRCIT